MNNQKEIYLAGGCFWGTEKYFSLIKGVMTTDVGYANGNIENPSYEAVCHGDTGYAETVKIVYDSKEIKLESILEMYYEIIDPTVLNRQGNDRGTQYRTGIYYTDEKDQKSIKDSIKRLQKKYTKAIVIEALPLENYYSAESYHQNYLEKNPDGYCHIGKKEFDKAKNFI